MLESAGKHIPQILKMTLLKKLLDKYFEHIKSKMGGKEKVTKAKEFIDNFIDEEATIKGYTNVDEVKKIMYENDG